MSIPAAEVLAGVTAHTIILINSHETADTWRERLNIPGPIRILPAAEDVADRAAMPYVGVACAAAAARLVGVIPESSLQQAIKSELMLLGAEVVEKNLAKASEAFALLTENSGLVTESAELSVEDYAAPDWIELPFEEAKLSAPDIFAGLTSVEVKTGLWRTMRPVIDYDRCNRCWWVCSTFCPDGVISVNAEGCPEIDYDHCKGCLICVAKCPPHAIEAIAEHEAQESMKESG